MKLFLAIVILFTALLSAKERPKIALVLSGGGARGGAHVGVLRILEEKKIPIDLIIGTSMGSFVGGLYASGKTPDEIDEMLTTTNWDDYIRSEFIREDMPIRQKLYDHIYNGRTRIGLNSKNEISLPTGMLNRQPLLFKMLSQTQDVENITNFDDLPIPFRAVATDIGNGNEVVLSSGSLSKAIYASSAIPGGLQPIEIDGKTLIDGGVSNNIPVLLAKKMGADIIIAVDVSEHFNPDLNLNSYFGVLGQLVNILMRKNADFSISLLQENDVLITPDLDGFTGLDAGKYGSIIQRGEDATIELYETKLKILSVSDEEYEAYKEKHRYKPAVSHRYIDKIVIENDTFIGDKAILQRLHFKIGDEIDEDKIRNNLIHLYNMAIFDTIDYTIKTINDENIITIIAKPSWNANGDIRFAMNLEDDFAGHSSYSIKIGYTMYGINSFGGEWRNDFEIGKRQKIYTEFFQPLDVMQRYYLRPMLKYEKWIDLVPLGGGNQEVKLNSIGADLVFGAHITTDYQFEVGLSFSDEENRADFKNAPSQIQNYDSRKIFVSALVDSLDNYNFPTFGLKADIQLDYQLSALGSDYQMTKLTMAMEKPFSYHNNSLVAYAKMGTRLDDSTAKVPVSDLFFLGGMFNLSGYKKYSFYDSNMFFGALKYRYRIKDGGFLGAVGVPLYAGFTVESGSVWGQNTSKKPLGNLIVAGSAYIAADTFLGPFYLTYGRSEAANQTVYLYLGEKF